jgi:hypothetical protein
LRVYWADQKYREYSQGEFIHGLYTFQATVDVRT